MTYPLLGEVSISSKVCGITTSILKSMDERTKVVDVELLSSKTNLENINDY